MKLLIPLAALGFALVKANPFPRPDSLFDENAAALAEECEDEPIEEMDLPEVKAGNLDSDYMYEKPDETNEDCLDDENGADENLLDLVLPAESDGDDYFGGLKSDSLDDGYGDNNEAYNDECEEEEPAYMEEPSVKGAGGLDYPAPEFPAEVEADCEGEYDEDVEELEDFGPALKSSGLDPLDNVGAAYSDLDSKVELEGDADAADDECEEY